MTIDEQSRLELAEAAKRTFGERAGVTLMEMLPPVGWADVATKHDLAALEERLDLRFAGVDQRFVSVNERFDAMDQRFVAMERHLDLRLDGLRHELQAGFHRDQVMLTWRYLGVTGSMFVAFSTLLTLVVKL